MILGDPAFATVQSDGAASVTIDDLFRAHARRRPQALALIDAANRTTFTDGAPRRLTYAQADRAVAAIAGRLRLMGLPTDSVVAVQLPNVTEHVLTILAVLRAGMIVASLPLLYRRNEISAVLGRVGAKALITCRRAGTFNHARMAMDVGADVFSIRYLGGFGHDLPDGVVPFDDLLAPEQGVEAFVAEGERRSAPAAHVAAITFDVGDSGVVPVARSHIELLAGGLAVLMESCLAQDACIGSTIAPTSFAGMSLTLMPWLMCGGTLLLHHPFDPPTLVAQARDERCAALVVPGLVLEPLLAAGTFAGSAARSVIAAWRAPEQLAPSPVWNDPAVALVDVAIFGETGLLPARRRADGRPRTLPLGQVLVPRDSSDGAAVAEVALTEAGTLALRGPMVPDHPFPPGIESSGLPYFKIGPRGLVDTGYRARLDHPTGGVVVTDPPAGLVAVGGYRFTLDDLAAMAELIDGQAGIATTPDSAVGQRLIGRAADRAGAAAALTTAGVNPLVIGAFRRPAQPTATAA